jgi:hypothetical protein
MGMEKRKAERLGGRFTVAVREKLATWTTTTEDVSARGCRIELRRSLSPGALVQVVFDMGQGAEPLVAHGQVAWVRRAPTPSAGIAFLSVPRQASDGGAQKASWIDRLLAVYVRRIDGTRAANDPPAAPRQAVAAGGRVIVPPVA